MEEYRRTVEAYAARHENYLFHNEGNEHALIIFENIFKNGRNRQTLWGGCTDANPKLLLNDT